MTSQLDFQPPPKLTDPFSVLAIISFILSILALFGFGAWQTLLWSTLGMVFILLLYLAKHRYVQWSKSKDGVKFYHNWKEMPRQYEAINTLKYLSHNTAKLEIIGRTCFRWLCGDEIAFEKDQNAFQAQAVLLQDHILEAIQRGSSIHFVLQNPYIPVPSFEKVENDRLRLHASTAIANYEAIRAKLKHDARTRITLSFLDDLIENSMVRLIHNSKTIRFIVDFTIRFKSSNISLGQLSKPILSFPTTISANDEFYREFEYILSNTMPKEKFDQQKEAGRNEVKLLIKGYTHHSTLRKDHSRLLAKKAANYFPNGNSSQYKEVPPASAQILITNQCTTFCTMCDHFKLFKPKQELTKDEVFCTFDCFKDIGTSSIVLSGGEPLARRDLFDILQYGKSLGLNLGLITNGILREGKPLDLERAKILADSCSWIQLSVDSFNSETYKLIRGNGALPIALDSLSNIVKTGFKNAEVCFTIQKANVEEIAGISDAVNNLLPPSVLLRFKFAHGPIAGRDFLCSISQLEEAIRNLPRNNPRFNSNYLISMINSGYFDYEGLSHGTPLKNKMIQYRSLGYTCHAIRITCLVDSNGDVYPCCYLFDDNNASSKLRSQTIIGSLRSSTTGRVMPVDTSGNALSMVWYNNDKLRRMRQSILPVENEACNYCTRFFYQNDYLNQFTRVFEKYHKYGLAEEVSNYTENLSNDKFWL